MGSEQLLSEREREILRLLATGASNKEIAQHLKISPNTVRVHLRNIFGKTGVSSRTEAALYALRQGIVVPPDPALATRPSAQEPGGVFPVEIAPVGEERSEGVGKITEQPRQRGVRGLWLVAVGVLAAILAVGWQAWARFNRPVPQTTAATVQITTPRRWQEQTALPEPRSGMAGAVYEDVLYLIGGETPGGITSSVLRLGADQRWKEVSPKPTAVSEAQAALVGEKIYVAGGRLAHGQPTDRLEVYDPRADRWEAQTPLPHPLLGEALAAYEGRLYLFGGWDGQKESAQVLVYDPANGQWQAGTPLPSARSYAAAVAIEGKILVIGGRSDGLPLDETLAYFPARDLAGESPWEERSALPFGRFGGAAAQLAGQVYLVGGSGAAQRETQAPMQYSPSADLWLPLELPLQPVGAFAVLLPAGEQLHALGGQPGEQLSRQHQTYQAIYTIPIPVLN